MDSRSVHYYRCEFHFSEKLESGEITEEQFDSEMKKIRDMGSQELEQFCEENDIPGEESIGT